MYHVNKITSDLYMLLDTSCLHAVFALKAFATHQTLLQQQKQPVWGLTL